MQSFRDTVHHSSSTARRTLAVLLAAVAVIVTFGLSGCGPVQSTQRISEAEVAFERARVVQAHEKAPYEYYSAKYYLHKSKEEWGYSDFEASYDYARQAKQAAEAAILKAKEDPWEGSPVKNKKAEGEDTGESTGENSSPEEGPQGY